MFGNKNKLQKKGRKEAIFLCFLILELFTFCAVKANVANIEFYNLNKEYGISIRETNQVCSDDHGFIWISSKMGVVRYSQGDVRLYRLPYDTGDIITLGIAYRLGNLYAYSNNGQIFKYNSILDRFELVLNLSKTINNSYVSVNSVLVDAIGKLWIASSAGLFSYTVEQGLKSLTTNISIHHLYWKDDFHFFCCISDKIKVYDSQTVEQYTFFQFPDNNDRIVSSMYFDPETKDLWLGTLANGLYKIESIADSVEMKYLKHIPNQPILDIEIMPDNSLFIGVDGQGIWNIDKTGNVVEVYKEDSDNPTSLKGNGVYDIYCAPNGRVWICTYSGGVSFFDLAGSDITKVSHIVNDSNSLVNNDVNDVLEDTSGNIWFATNNGVSRWEPNKNRWKSFYHNKQEHAQVFLSLCEAKDGNIWAGTYSSGVYIMDKNTGKEIAHYSNEINGGAFKNNFVFDIEKDAQNDIWIGGVRGDLVHYDAKTGQFNSYSDVTVNVMVDFTVDELLIGTTYGLLLFNKRSGVIKVLVEGFLVYDVYKIGSKVWLATSGDGVILYDLESETVKQINIDAGLPSNIVNSLDYTPGYLWAGTEQGLCRISEHDLTTLAFRSVQNLSNVSFNQNAHYKLSNGNLMFGTNMGGIIIDPAQLEPANERGRIFFQDLIVSGRSIRDIDGLLPKKPIDSIQNIALNYYQNNLSLELLPIGVASAGYKFSWKLEGLDKQWSKPDNNSILSYSNIHSGDYVLHIRMYDNSIANVIAERSIGIKLVPPVWERWYFKTSILVFILGLAIFFFMYYVDRLRKQHSEEKIRFFVNTAHDIRTSLTLINGPVEELNKEKGLSGKGIHYLHLATEQTHRLSNVVTQLMDFQKVDIGKQRFKFSKVNLVKFIENRVMMFEAYANSRNLKINFQADSDECETAIDEMVVEKIIDNLLSNAIKYSYENSRIEVSFKCLANKWMLDVQDYGIGIRKKAQKQLFKEYYRGENAVNSKIVGSGIGLLLVKNYVTLLGGKITCQSQDKKGSLFQVVIPFSKPQNLNETQNSSVVPMEYELSDLSTSNRLEQGLAIGKKPLMKVLIVEDHDYLREFLKTALKDHYQIFIAEEGETAWLLVEKHTPDLVVSDIMMPKMDGFELCRKIKSTYETSHIAVILLTSLSGKAQQLKGLGLGADDYLTKPFDVTLLQQRIKTIIQNREIIRDKALKIIKHDENEVPIFENELNDQFLKKAVCVVRENIENPEFSKDLFASEMLVSPSLLYKKVKALTNQSPTDFIKSIRLERAMELLLTKKHTVTEISEMCGFSSVGYFSTVFRKHYGKSPTQIN